MSDRNLSLFIDWRAFYRSYRFGIWAAVAVFLFYSAAWFKSVADGLPLPWWRPLVSLALVLVVVRFGYQKGNSPVFKLDDRELVYGFWNRTTISRDSVSSVQWSNDESVGLRLRDGAVHSIRISWLTPGDRERCIQALRAATTEP